jgi:hypothetical protein
MIPINQTLQNILIILREARISVFKVPGMSCHGILALPLASRYSLLTVAKRLDRNILGLVHLAPLERRRREPPVLTFLSFLEMLNIDMIEPLIQGLGAMVL